MWRADLDAAGNDEKDPRRLLDARERARGETIVRARARRRWMTARGVLRALLGAHLDEDPRTLRFTLSPNGKPTLDLPGREPVHFNLSHSGPLAVYGVSDTCPVGIDVESLNRLHGRPRHAAFLRAWVRHEAAVKRVGGRVGNAPAQIPDVPEHAFGDDKKAWVAELELGDGALGAVELAYAPQTVLLRDWPI